MAATGLAGGEYDLTISSFAACHLADLDGFFAEAARLLRSGGKLVLVDYHPFMLLNGVPTHFNAPTGETLAIANTIHLFSDHIWAARNAGLALLELREGLVGEQWIREKPGMARYAGQPVSFAMIWAYN